jgi:hypothetical protein
LRERTQLATTGAPGRETGDTLTLYAFAITPENVELALKTAREPQPVGFEALLPEGVAPEDET